MERFKTQILLLQTQNHIECIWFCVQCSPDTLDSTCCVRYCVCLIYLFVFLIHIFWFCIVGVFTTTIDPQQQKVTVTGNVAVETLIRKLAKAGKHAEVLPVNLPAKGKDSNKAKNSNKSEQRDKEQKKNNSSENSTESNHSSSGKDKVVENAEKCMGEKNSNKTKTKVSPGKSPASCKKPGKDNKGGGDSGKKKMKKVESGGETGTRNNGLSSASNGAPAHIGSGFHSPGKVVGQVNLSPTRQQQPYMLYPETCYPPLVQQYAAYNRLCPMGTMDCPSYYVPPLPYMCSGLDRDSYQFQSTPLIPFEFFSDENANGCFIM